MKLDIITIIEKAIDLFLEKGYEQTEISDIANCLNCEVKEILDFFNNRQEVLDQIIEESGKGYQRGMRALEVDYENDIYELPTVEVLVRKTKDLLLYALNQTMAKKIRKLMRQEQENLPELETIYSEHYVNLQIARHEELFRKMIEQGVLKDENPETLATLFVAPIIVLIDLVDEDPTKESFALTSIEKHVRKFVAKYSI